MLVNDRKGGVVTSTVMGVGGLIIGVIIILVLVSTLNNANLFPDTTKTIAVTNESGVWINITGYTLNNYNSSWTGITVTNIVNATDGDGTAVAVANYTLTTVGYLDNKTAVTFADVNISYTYVYTIANNEGSSVTEMSGNFTDGIDEISTKIPTILLIVAVVFLFGALVLLVNQARKMGVLGGSGSGSL